MQTTRTTSALMLLLLAACIAQAAPPVIPQGWSKYIIILNDASFRPASGHAAVAAPNIPQLGGMVLVQWGRRISVALPPGLAQTLRNHPAVREIQRVYTGTPLPPEAPPSVLRLQTDAVHAGADSAPPTWSSGEYVYDGSGNIKSIGWGAGSTLNGDGKANTYIYDTAGRLVSATANYAVNGTETYAYDAFGNMTSVTHNGQTSSFAVDSGSNRLQGVLYDIAGNLVNDGTQWYGYDALNMLRQQSGFREGEAYIYTADDERIGVDTGLNVRWTVRDFDGNVLREFDGFSDWDWSFVRDYIYRDGQLLASHGEMADGSTLIHYHLDHLGTPRLVTTQNKRRLTQDDYFPFGTEQTSLSQAMTVFGFESELTHRFTGHERDFLGDPTFEDVPYIDYMHARYYEPKRGRFLSVDPVLGNLLRPQSWNRYAYVLSDPLSNIDPSGTTDVGITDWGEAVSRLCALQPDQCRTGHYPVNADNWLGHVWHSVTGWLTGGSKNSATSELCLECPQYGDFITVTAADPNPAARPAPPLDYRVADAVGGTDFLAAMLSGNPKFFGSMYRKQFGWALTGIPGANTSEAHWMEWWIEGRGARSFGEQLLMEDAAAGGGVRIMEGEINDPRFPEDLYAKMSVSRKGVGDVHYWLELATGRRFGFKFK